jgi:sugar lactone lactonase YvrE
MMLTSETRPNRYAGQTSVAVENGWTMRALTCPSQLFVANGLRKGPDGSLYVAQAFGGRVSSINLDTHEVQTVYDGDGPTLAPDDLAFDSQGAMYVTDVMRGQVCVTWPNGVTEVFAGALPGANGITIHQDRIFIDECRHSGRLMELFRNGDAPRLLADNLPSPNALAVGPDGYHYFPALETNSILRVPLDGGAAETFAADLGMPLAVKFNSKGELFSVQGRTGQVLKFDLRTGARSCIAALRPGLDNLEITPDDRLFVSHFIDGGVAEITAGGKEQPLTRPGLLGPYGLSCSSEGVLFGADGIAIIARQPDGAFERVGHIMDGEFPGWVNGVACAPRGMLAVSTSSGTVKSYHPFSHEQFVHVEGLNELGGVAVDSAGTIFVTESGEGRLLEISGTTTTVKGTGLSRPTGVAVAPGGMVYVCEAGGGRVSRVDGGVQTVIDGLEDPQGITIAGDTLFVLDAGTRQLIGLSLATGEVRTVASHLSIGGPRGMPARLLTGMPGILPGPLRPFAGLAAGPDGTIFIGANGAGALLALVPA